MLSSMVVKYFIVGGGPLGQGQYLCFKTFPLILDFHNYVNFKKRLFKLLKTAEIAHSLCMYCNVRRRHGGQRWGFG